ncbi:hypothetical protein Q8A67_008661 [Cirrhinus molitorella]|uniref:Uncharacterized protein n=1 Tax=Cirrhinus molitorella TaxID=172907 RepID=A0AA88TSK8_9TELE|nr:hypothetical protein Q8A67_008661 [Cirrhinus molitorella]
MLKSHLFVYVTDLDDAGGRAKASNPAGGELNLRQKCTLNVLWKGQEECSKKAHQSLTTRGHNPQPLCCFSPGLKTMTD